MPALLAFVFLVMPVVELYVIIKVGASIGLLPTLGLLILASVVGGWLVKREGAKTWRAFRNATEQGRVPAREVADGVLVIFGGALLMTPGFVTDVLGLLCVAPPTRALVRRSLLGVATSRVGVLRWFSFGQAGAQRVSKVRSRRAPASDRRPANVPPPD